MPTLPFVTTKLLCGVDVPIPTLPPLVSYTLLPVTVHPLTPPADDHVAFPLLSSAVNTSPNAGTPELIAKPTVRTVPCTSSA